MAKKNKVLTYTRREQYTKDSATIEYLRENPCIAAELLLGVQLLDMQAYILQSS